MISIINILSQIELFGWQEAGQLNCKGDKEGSVFITVDNMEYITTER